MARSTVKGAFRVTAALREKHDYRQDTAWDGRYLMRLPDRTLVPAVDYEKRLADYRRRLALSE